MRVEFRLLGPLEVWCDGRNLPVPSGRQRCVLAMLLLNPNRVVAVDDLAEALWGPAPPPSARVTVQNYAGRLRDALGGAADRVVTQVPGYLIRVAPDEVDVGVLEAALAAARAAAAAGSWDSAEASARAALVPWRGEPLADVPSEYLAMREVTRLADMRLQAAEIGIESALHLGRHAAVVGELRQLVAASPHRERLSALLMAALHADGRQAEALAVYQQARTALVTDLGVEPGQELRAAQQRILAGDPVLLPAAPQPSLEQSLPNGTAIPPDDGAGVGAEEEVPRQADVAHPGPGGRLGVLLRSYRLAAGLSQEELAERSGLSARTVANMERGRTARPHPRNVRALAAALDLEEPDRAALERASRPDTADEPAPSSPSSAQGTGEGSLPVPRQLPRAVAGFTGREKELASLTRFLWPQPRTGMPTLVISAIGGTAGVGKTALAVHWAHRIAGQFPDGQLYVNLRGYDPHDPVSAGDALAGFLRALGVPGQQIPDELDERASLYRSQLAGRRMLLLLDNARDGEHVRPLLPGDPGCVAVVTSRDALVGLVAADGARRLDLDALPPTEAVALLRSLIGPRVDADPEAAAHLAGLCARLPLALRIAAELAAARPAVPLAALAAELAAGRLDGLDAGEARADVRGVISWSLRQLPDDAAAAFALVGLHPGNDLDVHAAAALTGTPVGQAGQVLDLLRRASLIQAAGSGRYAMHDLLRVYAREDAAVRETDSSSDKALTRLFDYYLVTAAAATDLLFPADAQARPRISSGAVVSPAMSGAAAAHTWLDAERANLVAVVAHCADRGWARHATDFADILFRYLIGGSHLPEADSIYTHALQAARSSGDVAAEATALRGLGSMGLMKGRLRDAASYYQDALACYRECGDRSGEARVLYNLGLAERDNHLASAEYYRQAIAAFEDAGDRLNAARVLADLADAETELGSYDQAAEHLQLALPVLRAAEDRLYEAGVLERVGELHLRRGQLTEAAGYFEQALAIFRRVGHLAGVAAALLDLGSVSLRQGEYQQASSQLRQALTLHRKTGYQHGEIKALRALAQALDGIGQPRAACAQLVTALRLAAETGNTYQQACTHSELAEIYCCSGHDDEARDHWQQAMELYRQLGAPEADQILSRLRPSA
jgi:DNA-binding SARP family transcriptional activator/tetratricopeptide (TPR) repeat protein/transcriptional regulator with XRE-family HTH domain